LLPCVNVPATELPSALTVPSNLTPMPPKDILSVVPCTVIALAECPAASDRCCTSSPSGHRHW
jgi:hypothetical protein